MEPRIVFESEEPTQEVQNELLASLRTISGMFPERVRHYLSDAKGNLYRAELWHYQDRGPCFRLKFVSYKPLPSAPF